MSTDVKPRIIFLTEIHFTRRDYNRFGVETLLQNGFDVEFWDFTPFLTNKSYQKAPISDPIQWKGHIKFENEKNAVSAILGLKQPDVIFSLLTYNIKTLKIYRAIAQSRIFYCEQVHAYPISALWLKQRFSRKLASFSVEKLCNRIMSKLPYKVLGVRAVDLLLVNAEKFMRITGPTNDKSRILWTHNFDYDLFLKIKDKPAPAKKDRGVFLDQYHPFHTDWLFVGQKSPFNAEEYYGALRRFFDHLEHAHGVRIAVAAHPRSRYEDKPDLFGGREVIRGKTVELVRDAGFVMAHNSASVNLAVLFKKPLIFLTTDRINENYKNGLDEPSIAWLADLFGKEAHNVDHLIQIDFDKEMVINEEAYRKFKNSYIKKEGSQELPYWQIFADYIKKKEAHGQFQAQH